MLNLASFSTSLVFERSAVENVARYLQFETNSVSTDDGPVSSPGLMKFGPRTPQNRRVFGTPLILDGENVLNRQ